MNLFRPDFFDSFNHSQENSIHLEVRVYGTDGSRPRRKRQGKMSLTALMYRVITTCVRPAAPFQSALMIWKPMGVKLRRHRVQMRQIPKIAARWW